MIYQVDKFVVNEVSLISLIKIIIYGTLFHKLINWTDSCTFDRMHNLKIHMKPFLT